MERRNWQYLRDITGQVARLILFDACMIRIAGRASVVGGKNAEGL
jgi:hypothetical protein